MAKRLVKLTDVAKAAGVSLGTASNAFNRPERVRVDLRERVKAAAEALGYAGPDPKARLLMSGKVNGIGFVPGNPMPLAFDWPYFKTFLAGVTEICEERKAVLVLVPGSDEEVETLSVNTALVDGFILHNPKPESVGRLLSLASLRRLPVVAVDMDVPSDVTSLLIANRDGARAAMHHLLALGHRRIAIFSLLIPDRGNEGPIYHPPGRSAAGLLESYVDARERFAGYTEALAEAGIAIENVPVVESLPGADEAARASAMLLDAAPETTAVVTMADYFAIALLDEARRRGLRVPDDLSVVGFDDVPEAAAADPPLTTIAQPAREKGRIAARLLFDPPPETVQIVLPVELVVRASTAPPRKP